MKHITKSIAVLFIALFSCLFMGQNGCESESIKKNLHSGILNLKSSSYTKNTDETYTLTASIDNDALLFITKDSPQKTIYTERILDFIQKLNDNKWKLSGSPIAIVYFDPETKFKQIYKGVVVSLSTESNGSLSLILKEMNTSSIPLNTNLGLIFSQIEASYTDPQLADLAMEGPEIGSSAKCNTSLVQACHGNKGCSWVCIL